MADQPIRIQRSRAAGWRRPAGALIVDRGTIFGNPWQPGSPCHADVLLEIANG